MVLVCVVAAQLYEDKEENRIFCVGRSGSVQLELGYAAFGTHGMGVLDSCRFVLFLSFCFRPMGYL